MSKQIELIIKFPNDGEERSYIFNEENIDGIVIPWLYDSIEVGRTPNDTESSFGYIKLAYK